MVQYLDIEPPVISSQREWENEWIKCFSLLSLKWWASGRVEMDLNLRIVPTLQGINGELFGERLFHVVSGNRFAYSRNTRIGLKKGYEKSSPSIPSAFPKEAVQLTPLENR